MDIKLKICGITRREDLAFAVEAGADFIGFIFHESSPRHTTPENVAEITTGLPDRVKKTGVFVKQSVTQIKRIAEFCKLDIIQLHGPYTAEDAFSIGIEKVWKAFNFNDPDAIKESLNFPADAVLADAMTVQKHGGTGLQCNWQAAAKVAAKRKVILAGGLNPENAIEAVKAVRPYAIDVNSGVEQAPGIKDLKLIARMADTMEKIKGITL
ncbi:phosphoribosylanthranilate isomerase [Lentisphaerota bacterium ZTH]|nr:phosphoribosylanthranilate isomerase [Lentisphaerota bacterium]WET05400.1 phosphoribosylanthranilate isomerase [Lentisphaerota bacterium ZTH]